MEFIHPMEPKSQKVIPTGANWIGHIKWDGVRILTYYDGASTILLNRRKNVRTVHYPELTDIHSYCSASSVILDGEVIALGSDGKPSFHEVMRRDSIRRLERIGRIQSSVPIAYMIFDIVYLNGIWLTSTPLSQRLDILNAIITPNDHVQVVAGFPDGVELFKSMQGLNMEGVVIKQLDSPYLIGQKRDYWVKIKNYKDVIAVIGGMTLRNGIINTVLLGLFNDGQQFIYIGHAGTGKLTASEWKSLTQKLLQLTVSHCIFTNAPSRTQAVWTKPSLCVKVKFMEWTDHHLLRQPSIQSIVEVAPELCKFEPDDAP